MSILLNDDDACIDFKGQIQPPVHHHYQDTITSMNVISFQHLLFPIVVISVMAIIIFTLVTCKKRHQYLRVTEDTECDLQLSEVIDSHNEGTNIEKSSIPEVEMSANVEAGKTIC